jgi:hypothetical protein
MNATRTIHGGGAYRYPSVWGEIHTQESLDEITLVRLIRAIEALNFTPKDVTAAHIGPTMVTLDILQFNGDNLEVPLKTRSYSVKVP